MAVTTQEVMTPARKNWIGHSYLRREDLRLLTGKGRFVANLSPFPNTYSAAILRSPYPHARIVNIDASKAEKIPGVLGVITGRDVARMARPFPVGVNIPMKYYPCAIDKVRYVGEPVAVVVARNRYIAEDALAEIKVDYEPLPAVVDAEEALREGAPILHEELGTNLVHHRTFSYGDPDEAFRTCARVIRGRFTFPKTSPTPLETYAVIARYDSPSDSYEIWANFHGPFSLLTVLAASLGVPVSKVRVLVPPDIGGSFGIKSALYPYMALIALASKYFRVPVQWLEDRAEHLAASSASPDRVTYAEMACDHQGIITGLRLKFIENVGAYLRAPEPACLYRTHGNITGPYRIKNVFLEAMAVVTNKCPTGLYRGYGGPPLYFVIERLMDWVAEAFSLDPAEVRRRNFIRSDEFPYRTPSGGLYDSGDYHAVLEKALQKLDYPAWRHQQAQARREGRWIGIGIACAVEPSGSNMGYISVAKTPDERALELPKSGCTESVTVACTPAGGFVVRLNSVPTGQGHETAAAQIAAQELGVHPDDIQVVAEMDTLNRPWSISTGSYSSRFAPLCASSLVLACRKLKERLRHIAAHLLGADPEDLELREGHFVNKSEPEQRISLRRVIGTVYWNPQALPLHMDPGLEVTVHFNVPYAEAPDPQDRVNSSIAYGFVADIAVVEVDRDTGFVRVIKYVSAHDAGRILNPMLADGQVAGSVIHGIAPALYEELVYDERGNFLSGSFMDYLCPTAAEAPPLEIVHHETPSPFTPLGAKGLGEGSTMTAPAAIAAAIEDALRPYGIRIDSLPVRPHDILDKILKSGGVFL